MFDEFTWYLGVFSRPGVLVNSAEYSGMSSMEAKEKIMNDLEEKGIARRFELNITKITI